SQIPYIAKLVCYKCRNLNKNWKLIWKCDMNCCCKNSKYTCKKITTLIDHHVRMYDKNDEITNNRFADAFNLTICKYPETLDNRDEETIYKYESLNNKCKRFYKKLS